jgi:hypothetical protein
MKVRVRFRFGRRRPRSSGAADGDGDDGVCRLSVERVPSVRLEVRRDRVGPVGVTQR